MYAWRLKFLDVKRPEASNKLHTTLPSLHSKVFISSHTPTHLFNNYPFCSRDARLSGDDALVKNSGGGGGVLGVTCFLKSLPYSAWNKKVSDQETLKKFSSKTYPIPGLGSIYCIKSSVIYNSNLIWAKSFLFQNWLKLWPFFLHIFKPCMTKNPFSKFYTDKKQ